ncbi:MAG TPA: right-handed parallel beta-helix repeat-containing protein [Candidatus Dormibacteraeota bacterium]|nr:right-handed parallel beta-helix repeat-containing protein [Candidatus Dormibacteraeota bacterium]
MRRRHRGWLAAFLAFALFAGLAALPRLLPASGSPSWVDAARNASPVDLPGTPPSLAPVRLSAVATPLRPDDAPAAAPSWDPTHMAALVAAEDLRLRTLLHHANRITAAGVVTVPGALPTLVLPPRPQPYGLADLESGGAVTQLQTPGQMVLVESVLVTRGATLTLGGGGLTTLLMSMTATGFTSLVTWGGTLRLAGDAQTPFTVEGWDQTNNEPAQNRGYGRPYIRSVGGRLDLVDVHVSSLGFWSGRTGGVAWTGINRQASTGSAVSSTFVGDTYGAFLSRANGVQLKDDLFEMNELDGVRLHRSANNVNVIASAAARNGGNGFVVSRGASNDALQGDVAVHNTGNGFFVDGRALVSGASPSGGRAVASVGTLLAGSDSEHNMKAAFIVEGGSGTIIQNNVAVSDSTGIAVRAGATNTVIVGNDVRSGGRVALSIGPSVTGTTVAGNTLLDARIGILIRNSPGVRLMHNRIGGMSVFAISVRGTSQGVVGNGNAVGGRGFDPIDVRAGAPQPTLVGTDASAWQRRSELNWVGYLRYHPLLATWLVILVIVMLCLVVARFTRRSDRPYRHTVAWQSFADAEMVVTGRRLHPPLGFTVPAVEPVEVGELTA